MAHVKSVTPVYNVYGSTSTRKGSFDIMLSCGTAGLKDYSKDPIIKGHFFTENDYYGAKKGLRDPGEHGEDVIWHDGCGRNDAESGYRRYFPGI